MAGGKLEMNFSAQDEDWKGRIRNEHNCTKKFTEEWGFLARPVQDTPKNKQVYSVSPAKYFDRGTWTVSPKKIRPKTNGQVNASLTNEDLLAISSKPLSQRTALESVAFCHSKQSKLLSEARNLMYSRTSTSYGSRDSIEQFGVADFKHEATVEKAKCGMHRLPMV